MFVSRSILENTDARREWAQANQRNPMIMSVHRRRFLATQKSPTLKTPGLDWFTKYVKG